MSVTLTQHTHPHVTISKVHPIKSLNVQTKTLCIYIYIYTLTYKKACLKPISDKKKFQNLGKFTLFLYNYKPVSKKVVTLCKM